MPNGFGWGGAFRKNADGGFQYHTEGIGPKFLKLGGRVLYRQVYIDAFEESCLMASTQALAASDRATVIT